MADFLLLMHDDAVEPIREADWNTYLDALGASGALLGGSAVGGGACVRRAGPVPEISRRIVGYVKVRAADLDAARARVPGNPVYEAGGTVEVRELPRSR